MSTRVTVTWHNGGVVAVKSATTPDQMAALAHEAERLHRAGHPGVVAFVEHRVSDDRAELRTEYAGESLLRWRGTPAQAAGLVAAIAAIVADLHELGIVHGRLDASHVLLSTDGRPRLCGLSPAPDEAVEADDVAALGQLLQALVERARLNVPRRTSPLRWPRAQVAEHRALDQLIAHATDAIPTRRPTARALARSILTAIPGAELAPVGRNEPPEPSGPSEPGVSFAVPALEGTGDFEVLGDLDGEGTAIDEVFGDQTTAELDEIFVDRGWERGADPTQPLDRTSAPRSRAKGCRLHPRRPVGAVAVIGLAAVAAGAVALRAGAAGDPDAQERAQPAPGSPCASAEPDGADVDGDGCPDRVVVSGGVVEAGGQRWAVGAPGDAVALGDWDCDGRATPAVYRPSSGDVFVFADWAVADQPLAAAPVARVPGGRGLTRTSPTSASASGRCDGLAVRLASGAHHPIEVRP